MNSRGTRSGIGCDSTFTVSIRFGSSAFSSPCGTNMTSSGGTFERSNSRAASRQLSKSGWIRTCRITLAKKTHP
jgi:hypothetical protein